MKHYSQEKQDLWVLEVLGHEYRGFFVDVGAHDGYEWSNTLLLEQDFGWEGICVEPNPESFGRLRELRQCTCLNVALDATPGTRELVPAGMCGSFLGLERKEGPTITVTTTTLADITANVGTIDYISVDTEGAEELILYGYPLQEKGVKLLTVERPSQRIHAHILGQGFNRVRCYPQLDSFYLRRDLC